MAPAPPDPTALPYGIDALVVFDTETTDVDLETARIVTAFAGLIDLRTGQLTKSRLWLINPGVEISEGAAAVHGISNEVARTQGADADTAIGEIVASLRKVLTATGAPLTAYNARFDLTLLDREARRYGHEPLVPEYVIDPYVIDKAIDKFRRGKRTLTVTAAHYGITFDNAHEAEADATATGLLARQLLPRLTSQAPTLTELHALQRVWALEQASSLQVWLRKEKPDTVIEGGWPIVPVPVSSAAAA